jgi:hypothetical protein
MSQTGRNNKKYSAEFKIGVIMAMREHHLGYRETVRKNWGVPQEQDLNYINLVKRWEHIFLEEGATGLMKEHRGRATKMDNPKKGRQRKKTLDKEIENKLIAENQRLNETNEYLSMEIEYLKKLDALIRVQEQQNETYFYYVDYSDASSPVGSLR